MRLEHPLDARCADPALEALDHPHALHQGQCRHRPDLEVLRQLGLLVDVDLRDAQALPLLAGEVGDEALHAARRARVGCAEEDEDWSGVGGVGIHTNPFPLQTDLQTAGPEAPSTLTARCGSGTGSASRSASGSASAACSPL